MEAKLENGIAAEFAANVATATKTVILGRKNILTRTAGSVPGDEAMQLFTIPRGESRTWRLVKTHLYGRVE